MKSIKSRFHNIELIQHHWDEPNNGRMLWVVDLRINDLLVTERYFGSWNRTDVAEKYEPDSPDGRYFFVPAEGGGFVLDTLHDFAAIYFRCKGLSAATFLGNVYSNDWLFLVHRHEIILFNLRTQTQTALDFSHLSIRWAKPLGPNQLEITVAEPSHRPDTTFLFPL